MIHMPSCVGLLNVRGMLLRVQIVRPTLQEAAAHNDGQYCFTFTPITISALQSLISIYTFSSDGQEMTTVMARWVFWRTIYCVL